MFTVTTAAKTVLQGALQQDRTDEMLIRIQASEEDPQKLEFALDDEKDDDVTLRDEEGKTVLIIQSDLADQLQELILDFQQTDQGPGFVLLQASPDHA